MFSSRLPPSIEENRISAALARAMGRGPVCDLTETNPTVVGLDYPAQDILSALADPRALTYAPSPEGLLVARQAIAGYYTRFGARVDPERLTLTASTSEGYAHLFKLLCDPGDAVMIPEPSYPLFQHLAGLDAVRVIAYPLRYHRGWFLDAEELERALDPRARAILMVHPNNPTGSFTKRGELDRVARLAQSRGLALVSDEVFADYGFAPDADRVATLVGESRVLTFVLSGLSKPAGLPQVKLGWIHVSGPEAEVAAAQARLHLISDTYLSVATPVQWAAPRLIALADGLGAQIRDRVRQNRERVARAVAGTAIDLLTAEGGWSAILRVPRTRPEEEWVLRLLDEGVYLHPGYFFDLPAEGHLVISLICAPERVAHGIERLLRGGRRGVASGGPVPQAIEQEAEHLLPAGSLASLLGRLRGGDHLGFFIEGVTLGVAAVRHFAPPGKELLQIPNAAPMPISESSHVPDPGHGLHRLLGVKAPHAGVRSHRAKPAWRMW
jgi:aspartate/methionine/tyrosine aminotransferase